MSLLDTAPLVALKNLQEKTGRNVFDQLIRLFMDTTEPSVEDIKRHLNHAEYDLLSQKAHKLKSSCGNLGAIQMANICSQIESHISEQGLSDRVWLGNLVEELEQISSPTIREIRAFAS